jgi:hypothetical protein
MRIKPDWIAAAVCIAVGVLMAALPHLLAWRETGDPAWVADHDERFYLAVGSQGYFNHPDRLSDPVRAGDGPSLYKPLPLLPGVWAAKLLGLGPLGIGLAWRVLAGITIGLAWYVLARQKVARPWVAAALAVVLLCDGGLIEGRPIYRQAARSAQVAAGQGGGLFAGKPDLHPEWRISTPGVTMAYLIALLWAVSRAREVPTRGRIALAGLTFGLLFYVYFYYWTAAGLALLIALALDAGHRRVYFQVGWIGGLIGLPSVISDYLLKQKTASDWLERTDKFLPIGRFDELIAPRAMIVLLAVTLAWALVRRRDLIYVWALGAAGLLLTNHQVLTRLQIENFHWTYVWGPALSLFLVLAAAGELGDRTGWSRRAGRAVGVVALLMLGSGLWLRALEATRSRDCLVNALVLAEYEAERPPGRARPLAPNAVIGGDVDFVDYAAILDNLRPLASYCTTLSPTVINSEWDDRIALNDGVLLGRDRATFEAEQRQALDKSRWGPWGRDPALRARRLESRLADFDEVTKDLPAALDRYAVRYVALPRGLKPAYLASGWTQVESGPTWDVWERSASASTASPRGPAPAR